MAKNTIENIYVQYGAETKEFEKGVKEVNKMIKSNEKQAKYLQKQFLQTFDDKDIHKMEKSLELLEDAHKEVTKQAEHYEKALDDVAKGIKDLPEEEIIKMERALNDCSIKADNLSDDIKKTKKNLDALNSGEVDSLTKDFQKAEKAAKGVTEETNDLDKALNGLGLDTSSAGAAAGSIADVDMSAQGLLGTFKDLDPAARAIAAGITAVAAAMTGASRATDKLNNLFMELGPTAEAYGYDLEEMAMVTDDLAVKTGDLEGSTMAVQGAMALYGDEIKTNTGLMIAAVSVYKMNADGIMEVSEAQKIAESAQLNWNASILETNAIIHESEMLMTKYGAKGDDIADTFNEWGDTFEAVGYDMEEFFNTMEVGLMMGARSTDEMANAVNEMFIRISEGSPDVVAALDAIGISLQTAQDMLNNGQGPELMMDIIEGLYGMDDATQQLTASAAIFGTYGEEFITNMLQQDEAMQQLINSYGIMQNAQMLATNLMSVTSDQVYQMGINMGLSGNEAANLAYKLETVGFSSLNAAGKTIVLAASIKANGAAMGVTDAQMATMKNTLMILGDETATYGEKLQALNGNLVKFLFSQVLTEEQMEQVTVKYQEQIDKLQGYKTAMEQGTLASDALTNAVYNNYIANTELASSLTAAEFATMSFKQKTRELENANLISFNTMQQLNGLYNQFERSSQTAADKTTFFKGVMSSLTADGFTPNIENVITLINKYDSLNNKMDGTGLASNALTGDFLGVAKQTDQTSGEMIDYAQYMREAESTMEGARRKARELSDSLYDVEEAAAAASSAQSVLSSTPSSASASSMSYAAPPSNNYDVDTQAYAPQSAGINTQNNQKLYNISNLTIKSEVKDLDQFIPDLFEQLDEYADKVGG